MKLAIIGTGIAGMSAAWLLNQRHEVAVYEKDSRIGGHANTVDVKTAQGMIPVDTGFIVYNEANYPNLTALFRHLDVPTVKSNMSFAASLEGGALEYAGTGLDGLFGQRRNLLRPRFWRMLQGLRRFYDEAPNLLSTKQAETISLGDYLRQQNYDDAFVEDHLLPMGAAIWSSNLTDMKDYPAAAFIRFFQSHGLLQLKNRPQWRTVEGGSRVYVQRLTAAYQQHIRSSGVRHINRRQDRVDVTDSQGHVDHFDHVVIATHADEALKLLIDASEREQKLLGSWRYSHNRALLHQDSRLMPKRRRVWSSWNYIGGTRPDDFCLTYWMNRLQPIPSDVPLFVTLNPATPPAARQALQAFDYTHPIFDAAALESQAQLWSMQGQRRTWFCGSYFGYGFHEDALQSGLAVAEQLGGLQRPWQVAGANDRLQFSAPSQDLAA